MSNRAKEDLIHKLWQKYAPYWHICAAAIMAIVYLCSFIGLPARVSALEIKVEKIDVINQRVEDIAEFLQVPKRAGNDR